MEIDKTDYGIQGVMMETVITKEDVKVALEVLVKTGKISVHDAQYRVGKDGPTFSFEGVVTNLKGGVVPFVADAIDALTKPREPVVVNPTRRATDEEIEQIHARHSKEQTEADWYCMSGFGMLMSTADVALPLEEFKAKWREMEPKGAA